MPHVCRLLIDHFLVNPLLVQWFMDLYPDLTRDEARKWLGRYGTSGAPQLQRMALLSEGQKAKVVFSKMAKENAHLLLLDEPTNALDMEMIDSLAQALKVFKGGVLLVSHDMRLISQVNEHTARLVEKLADSALLLTR